MSPAELLSTRTGRTWFWRFWEFIDEQILHVEAMISGRRPAAFLFQLSYLEQSIEGMTNSAEDAREPPPAALGVTVAFMRREATDSARRGFDNPQQLWSNLDVLVAQLRVAGDAYLLAVPQPPARCGHPTFETMLSWDRDMPIEMKEKLLLQNRLRKERWQEEIRAAIRETQSRDPFRGRKHGR